MALSFERIWENTYSMAHYGEQNGDLMADPDVTFFHDSARGLWFPLSFLNNYAGYHAVYAEVNNGVMTVLDEAQQKDLAGFVNTWTQNITEQQEITL